MGALSSLIGVLLVFPLWKICRRAGLHPAWSLLAVFSTLGLLIITAVLALVEWPASKSEIATAKD